MSSVAIRLTLETGVAMARNAGPCIAIARKHLQRCGLASYSGARSGFEDMTSFLKPGKLVVLHDGHYYLAEDSFKSELTNNWSDLNTRQLADFLTESERRSSPDAVVVDIKHAPELREHIVGKPAFSHLDDAIAPKAPVVPEKKNFVAQIEDALQRSSERAAAQNQERANKVSKARGDGQTLEQVVEHLFGQQDRGVWA